MKRSKDSPDAMVERYLGSLEAQIMRALWDEPRLTVRSVVELLPGRRARAYTTVMTVMNRLFEKGLLLRELDGRANIYWPAMSQREFLDSISRKMVRTVLAEFGDAGVAAFVGELRGGGPAGVEKLRKLLAEES